MFLAHSENQAGAPAEPLRTHLTAVAKRCADYAAAFGAEQEARVAGLLHDLGKYSPRFLERLAGRAHHLDHWSPGAYAILLLYRQKALAAALAAQGHHVGLQEGAGQEIKQVLNLPRLAQVHPHNLTLTESDPQILLERFRQDGLSLPPEPSQSLYSLSGRPVADMLDARMLFSALTDADFIETEAHFEGDATCPRRPRPQGPSLDASRALDVLLRHVDELARYTDAAPNIRSLRDELRRSCLTAAAQPPGLFTLSAPTGSGKTLAMLAFALQHALLYPNLRRIVMVIPYLSIIEQTVRVYRQIFEPHFGPLYVLEQHSMAGTRDQAPETAEDNESVQRRTANLLAENWDAPLVVTTSVQCLESLFANRPAACRKLHRLAGSVIVFDEVQTLPAKLAVPTLAALSRLAQRYGSTIVFATATQPAFDHLHEKVRSYATGGWQPREIVPNAPEMFRHSARTQVTWDTDHTRPWDELAEELAGDQHSRVLCIVNTKRHAVHLTDLLKVRRCEGVYHLSTNMCPAHRQYVLDEVRHRLASHRPEPCRLIATQCVEAGVDLDFPVVWRALGPLEAIAQAAGRCNRNGRGQLGKVRVFLPEHDGVMYPLDGGYAQAADVTAMMLQQRGPAGMCIDDPELYQPYFRMLYDLTGRTLVDEDLDDAIQRRSFVDVATHYRLIKQNAVNVLVPYDRQTFTLLCERVHAQGRLTREWIAQARPHTVSLYRPRPDDSVWRYMKAVPGQAAGDEQWFLYDQPEHYDGTVGLRPPEEVPPWV